MACPRLPYSSPHAEHRIKAAAQPWAGPFVGQMQAVEAAQAALAPLRRVSAHAVARTFSSGGRPATQKPCGWRQHRW